MPQAVRSQADTRRNQNIFDQYGRMYAVSIDIKTGEPTGAILDAGWDDPFMTSRHLFKFKTGTHGEPMFDVRLVQWLDEKREEKRNWDRRHAYFKRHLPRTATDGEILEEAGPAPWPSVKALEMALGGSKGLLGLVPLSKEELKALEISADDAVSRGLKVETGKKQLVEA